GEDFGEARCVFRFGKWQKLCPLVHRRKRGRQAEIRRPLEFEPFGFPVSSPSTLQVSIQRGVQPGGDFARTAQRLLQRRCRGGLDQSGAYPPARWSAAYSSP